MDQVGLILLLPTRNPKDSKIAGNEQSVLA